MICKTGPKCPQTSAASRQTDYAWGAGIARPDDGGTPGDAHIKFDGCASRDYEIRPRFLRSAMAASGTIKNTSTMAHSRIPVPPSGAT